MQRSHFYRLLCACGFHLFHHTNMQATDELILGHLAMAMALAFLPFRLIVFLLIADLFTRNLEFRREHTAKVIRRLTEWWHRIPAAPVRFVEEDSEQAIRDHLS